MRRRHSGVSLIPFIPVPPDKGNGQNIRGPPRGLLRLLFRPGLGFRPHLDLHPTHVVWIGRVVTGRRFDQTSCSALSDAEPHLWAKPTPPRFAPLLGGLVDRSGHGAAGVAFVMACLSVRPQTSLLLLFSLLAQTAAVLVVASLRALSAGGRRRGAPALPECWERSLSKETRKILGPTPPRFVVLPRGIRRRRTLP